MGSVFIGSFIGLYGRFKEWDKDRNEIYNKEWNLIKEEFIIFKI